MDCFSPLVGVHRIATYLPTYVLIPNVRGRLGGVSRLFLLFTFESTSFTFLFFRLRLMIIRPRGGEPLSLLRKDWDRGD